MHKTLEKKRTDTKPRPKKQALTEAQIAVHWKEEQYIRPPARFIAQAYLNDPHIVERFSEKNFPECFRGPAGCEVLSNSHLTAELSK